MRSLMTRRTRRCMLWWTILQEAVFSRRYWGQRGDSQMKKHATISLNWSQQLSIVMKWKTLLIAISSHQIFCWTSKVKYSFLTLEWANSSLPITTFWKEISVLSDVWHLKCSASAPNQCFMIVLSMYGQLESLCISWWQRSTPLMEDCFPSFESRSKKTIQTSNLSPMHILDR